MSHCCEDHAETKPEKKEKKDNQEPKTRFGKYLYSVGKKEAEKEKGNPHEGCC